MPEQTNTPPISPKPRRDPYRLTGETFSNRYRIDEFAGMGSFGAVYRALDTRVGRTVAVKILKPDLGDDEATGARELFQREALTAGRLSHPHIVAVTDVDEDAGFAYLVMEWLEGRTLEDELRRRAPLSAEETCTLLAPIADALQAAHDAGVIHRDIKPANIHLGRQDRTLVKVLDFGIAKVVTSSTAVAASRVAGTVAYMSPEQLLNRPIDRRSDIYALGVVLYQMMAGALPFMGESHGHIIQQHIAAPPPLLCDARPDLPRLLTGVIQRALAKNPYDRQPSARELHREFIDALRHAQPAPTPPAPQPHPPAPFHPQPNAPVHRPTQPPAQPPTLPMGRDQQTTPPANYAQHPSQPGSNQLPTQVMPPPGYRQPDSTPMHFQAPPPYPYAQAPGNFPQPFQPAGTPHKRNARQILIGIAALVFLIVLVTAPKIIFFLGIIGFIATALFFGIKALRKARRPPFK